MLITPTRSAQSPPKPAISSGIAKRSVAPEVPGEEISVAPVITSTREIIKNIPAINRVTLAGDLKNDLAFDVGLAELVLVDIT
jgi:hypothetical protein